jgi:hypothetical protein
VTVWQKVTLNLCSVLAIRVGKARTYIRHVRYRTRYTIYDRSTRGTRVRFTRSAINIKNKGDKIYFRRVTKGQRKTGVQETREISLKYIPVPFPSTGQYPTVHCN